MPRWWVLDVVLRQLVGDVVGLADGQGHDGERRVLGAAGGELAAVGDEQVGHVVGRAEPADPPPLPSYSAAAGSIIGSAICGNASERWR